MSPSRPTAGTAWRGERTIFVAGHPRSGTTLLGRLLGAHPAVGYWEEPRLLEMVAGLAPRLQRLAETAAGDAGLQTADSPRHGRMRDHLDGPFAGDGELTRTLRDRWLRELLAVTRTGFLELADAPVLVEKTPDELSCFDVGHRLLPRAVFVHLVRDPRDIASSTLNWIRRWEWPGWLEADDDAVTAVSRQWAGTVEDALGLEPVLGDQLLRISYEDLVDDTRSMIDRVLGPIGLGWHASMEEFLRRGMGGLDRSAAGGYSDELSAEQISTVERHAGRVMARLGYS